MDTFTVESDTDIVVTSAVPRTARRPALWKDPPPVAGTLVSAGEVICADALQTLLFLQDDIADLVFLDPPFNLGKDYGNPDPKADRLGEAEYFQYLEQVVMEAIRVLRPGGALYLYHIPKWAIRFSAILEEHLQFRHWIAVSMKNGFVRGQGLYPAHYALLYYTKGDPAVSNRPKIAPMTCPNCDEYVKDYGGYRALIENGVNLSDVWDDLSPVRHKRYKHRFANELPMAIPKRIVGISGRRHGLIIDPFAGTGSSAVAARHIGMRFLVVDREPENCSIIVERLRAITERRKARKGAEK